MDDPRIPSAASVLAGDGEAALRFGEVGVAGIGGGDGEAAFHIAGILVDAGAAIGGLAGVAAVADHRETAVPIGRHADFETDLRQHLAEHAAVRRSFRRLGDRRGDGRRNLGVGETAQVGAAGHRLVLRAEDTGGGDHGRKNSHRSSLTQRSARLTVSSICILACG